MTDDRLEVFRNSGKMPWTERKKLIHEQFPSTVNLNWKKAFDKDVDLFTAILRDVLKVDQDSGGRPGPRPVLPHADAVRSYRRLMGDDFSTLPFAETFGLLIGTRSVRAVAHKTGLSRSQVHRLRRGEADPDLFEMEQVARGFGKQPSYFLEYRTAYIAGALLSRMEGLPESTIDMYRRLSSS